MKEWDRIIIKCFGEASFQAGDLLSRELRRYGYKEISQGSGSPESASAWWTVEYDRPIEEFDPERDEWSNV